ncbi:hypothetical protein AW736_21185 [Termitidicoccus mucosus]|uniref:Uncharacterized protein n=1 Tax=Termitidicoccus mucosus TaxID=1184151 RepID=A0A178IFU1_9BACT|nr:hypothetical protein AW736_21185 [Opitutaceae bacterium TSB47]
MQNRAQPFAESRSRGLDQIGAFTPSRGDAARSMMRNAGILLKDFLLARESCLFFRIGHSRQAPDRRTASDIVFL